MDATIEVTGAAKGHIQLLNPAGDALEIVAQRGFSREFIEHFASVRVDDGSACAEAWRTGQQKVIKDVSTDPSYARHRDIASRAGYSSVQSTPLLSRNNEVLGMLSTHYAQTSQPSETDLRMLYLYARQAADTIEYVRARDAQREMDLRKDEFLAMLGHELRNPLAAIHNTLEALRRDPSNDPKANQFRDVIERQTHSLLRLVDDLLQISRVTQGKIQLQKRAVALRAILANAMDESRGPGGEHQQEVNLHLTKPDIWVLGDATRLTQVFANLLNNARRYTPSEGHIEITASVEGSEAVVSVRDSGVGIAAEHLPRIFDMFYQAADAVRRSREGLGIGLALVKSLVELHGGRVEARSAGLGYGSEFIVRLPLAEAQAETEPVAPPPSAAQKSQLRILIVDDDPDQLAPLATMFELEGYLVHTALDGEQGLQVARSFRPHVALLDINMPKMNGHELARAIRAEPWGAAVVLIAQTGRGQERHRQLSAQAGFDHHLIKPIDMGDLIKLVAAVDSNAGPVP